MRTKENYPFFSGFGAFGPVRVVGIGFAAGPAGDAVAEHIIHLQVYFVGIAFFYKQVAKTIFIVINCRKA